MRICTNSYLLFVLPSPKSLGKTTVTHTKCNSRVIDWCYLNNFSFMSQYITFLYSFTLRFTFSFNGKSKSKNCFCNKSQIFITRVKDGCEDKMCLRRLKLSLKNFFLFIISFFFCHRKHFAQSFTILLKAKEIATCYGVEE